MANRFYPTPKGFVYVTTQYMEFETVEQTCKAFFEATGAQLVVIPGTDPYAYPDPEFLVLQDKMKKLEAIMSKYRATTGK